MYAWTKCVLKEDMYAWTKCVLKEDMYAWTKCVFKEDTVCTRGQSDILHKHVLLSIHTQ